MRVPEIVETKSYRLLRECLSEAIEYGINAVVGGPPSSEKSFVLENLREQFLADGKDVIYAYCGPMCTLTHLYRTIADAAEIPVRSGRWGAMIAVINGLRARPKLPAIILDEAQHLDTNALEGVRQIHDSTRRKDRHLGCGIVLAGSHGLIQYLEHPQRRARLEQMLSRFNRVQLTGMTQQEILTLAGRAFGNGKPAKFTKEQEKVLLERCSVSDPYYLGADGKPAPRTYFSSRRLLEYVRQTKKNVAGEEHAA